MIYLDNSATSFPKPAGMAAEMGDCMERCGNPGRSGHDMSMAAAEGVYQARRAVARLFHIEDASRLIFTKNTTESLNLAMMGLLQEGDHVVTTSMEHNSVLRPLERLTSKGVRHTIVTGSEEGFVSAEDIRAAMTGETRMVAVTGASNVTGTLQPLCDIGRVCAENRVPLLVDAAQLAGCAEIDAGKLGISLLAFPGHKGLLGPLGTGCLYVDPSVRLTPLLCGGTGTESRSRVQPEEFPEGFEAGTVNVPGIIGLGYSARVLQRVGVRAVEAYERELIRYFDELIQNMDFVDLYGPAPEGKTGISLFNIRGMECEETAARLNREYGIAVRGGYHCAGLAHRTIGTWHTGAVRLSVGPFNTRRELRTAAEAVWKIGKSAR